MTSGELALNGPVHRVVRRWILTKLNPKLVEVWVEDSGAFQATTGFVECQDGVEPSNGSRG